MKVLIKWDEIQQLFIDEWNTFIGLIVVLSMLFVGMVMFGSFTETVDKLFKKDDKEEDQR